MNQLRILEKHVIQDALGKHKESHIQRKVTQRLRNSRIAKASRIYGILTIKEEDRWMKTRRPKYYKIKRLKKCIRRNIKIWHNKNYTLGLHCACRPKKILLFNVGYLKNYWTSEFFGYNWVAILKWVIF